MVTSRTIIKIKDLREEYSSIHATTCGIFAKYERNRCRGVSVSDQCSNFFGPSGSVLLLDSGWRARLITMAIGADLVVLSH